MVISHVFTVSNTFEAISVDSEKIGDDSDFASFVYQRTQKSVKLDLNVDLDLPRVAAVEAFLAIRG